MRVVAWLMGAVLILSCVLVDAQMPTTTPASASPSTVALSKTTVAAEPLSPGGKPPPKIPPPSVPAARVIDPKFDAATGRTWVESMKASATGPFGRIRYFCSDGVILDPKAFLCEPHGGGYQHGEWNSETLKLRAAGYPIANLLVTVSPEQVVGPQSDPDLLSILVIERFLIANDDGWIYRKAQFYRGAIQDHNEKEAARELLVVLAGSDRSFLEVREAARAFPHGAETASLEKIRTMAAVLDDKDPHFHALRSRIHNAPEAADASRVRTYAAGSSAKPELKASYEELSAAIDQAYKPAPLSIALGRLSRFLRDPVQQTALQSLISAQSVAEKASTSFDNRLKSAGDVLVWLRDQAYPAVPAAARVLVLDTSLDAEQSFMVAASQALPTMPSLTREARLAWLAPASRALYGMGLLTHRESDSLASTLASLTGKVKLNDYRDDLEYLERASAWCSSRLKYYYGNGLDRLRPIEPLVEGFVPDRLRASPLLFYSTALQALRQDEDEVAGVSQQLFGESVGGGLRRLNPGIARGVLRTSVNNAGAGSAAAIFLVPETTSDLPAAVGILTEQEGNPVSHVQLLARNLGIPNVVVSRDLIPKLAPYDGKPIVLAASVGGLVEVSEDGPKWDDIMGKGDTHKSGVVIVPDLVKLNLLRADFVSTAVLRASDSGRICGPKAAHVGELTHRFPDNVSPGVAVTFGIYREVLNEPVRPGGPSMFEWMKQQYADLAVRRQLDPATHAKRVNAFLEFTRNWLNTVPLPPTLLDRMRGAMLDRFGMEGTYGVFVRSDTNIEDLPGFTGAGLNETIPNQVGFDNTVKALRRVWASPFTERAYGWRQDLMDQPEHIYVSVLLHRSVPNQKSGVMVTADVDTGDQKFLTVATSLGVGGGVDGEASESLHIDASSGKARLLSSATAREERILPLTGGAKMVPAPAPDAVLSQDEIEKLAQFAGRLPKEYVELHDDLGNVTPADIEFGFVNGQLMLQQIRPFLQNRSASRQEYLAAMDKQLQKNDSTKVNLDEKPKAGS